MSRAKTILNLFEVDIKVAADDDTISTIKKVKISQGNKGWKVVVKDGKYYISKDGKIYMEVDSNHPAIKR